MSAAAVPFAVDSAASLAGEAEGDGAGDPIVLLHGLTATRRYVVHGSRALPRAGYRAISYDARGHGESKPAPAGAGYSYDELSADLAAVLAAQAPGRRSVLAGHSMGAHTAMSRALADPDRIAAAVIIGPTWLGGIATPESLAGWDALADGLAEAGVEGFVAAYDRDLDPRWRDTLLRIARDRISLHRHPEAVADALRQVPRSAPFTDLSELEFCELPVLVVASHDEADPGHPRAAAEAWAERLPQATLIGEQPGDSPLAWQGGKLSREIDAFCQRPEVAARLRS